jgi:ABC-2 type transport system permease protein
MKPKILIVARQELILKFKSKVVIISAMFLVILAGVSPWIPQVLGGKTQSIRIAVLGEANVNYTKLKQSTSDSQITDNLKIIYLPVKSRKIAFEGLNDEKYAFVLGAAGEGLKLFTGQNSSFIARDYLVKSVNQLSAQKYLIGQGISMNSLNEYVKQHSIVVSETNEMKAKLDYSVALFSLVLLYMILSLSGGLLALTIIEEKSGRIMEVLLSSISPKQLLIGKILGVMLFSIIQFLAIVTTWIVSSNMAHSSVIDGVTITQILFYLAWFVPALLSYSFIYGGLGALVSRSEDSGAIQGPMSLMLLASVYGAAYSLSNSSSELVAVAMYIPPFNFFITPAQYLSTGKLTCSMAIGYSIALIFTAVVLNVAMNLFEKNVLNNHRFSFRLALRL